MDTMTAQPEVPSVSAPGSRRQRVSWYFYDWANSAFATTVLAAFLSPYLTTVAKAASDAGGFVYPLGIRVSADSFAPYMLSLAALLQVFTLPVLGAIADHSNLKKQMLGFFAYFGAFATMGLYFLQGTNYLLGGGLFLLANLSFGASIVFYYSFLPEIAGPDQRDSVSSTGWATGYLGGGLLLALNSILVFQAEALGLSRVDAVRISLASAGVWWAIFTLIPMFGLKPRQPAKSLPPGHRYLTTGFKQLYHTLKNARAYPQTLLFLAAFLLYSDGIQTVVGMSSQFGQEELGLDLSTLGSVILMVQFIAFFGALIFNYVAKAVGTKRAITYSLLIWTATLIYAYGFLQTTLQFFILAGAIAIVLGGSQALSRSAYSQLIPRGQEAEYFSLYELGERGTSSLGPLLVGLALQFTGNYRLAILSPVIFFVLGMALLAFANIRKGAIDAGNQPPTKA